MGNNDDTGYVAVPADGNPELSTEMAIYGSDVQHDSHAVSPEVLDSINAIRKPMQLNNEYKTLLFVMWIRRKSVSFSTRDHKHQH